MHEIDLDKANRETVRWRILKALDAGRPLPVSEVTLLQVLQDATLHVTPHGLRRELDYLEDRKLVVIQGKTGPVWSAELTHYGVDVVEHTVECFPGIARPKKWY